MADETKRLTLEEIRELNAYFGEHGELPHGVEEALLEMAVCYYELRALAESAPPPAESLNAWAVRCIDLWVAHQEDSAMVIVLSRTGADWCCGVHGRDRKPLGYLGTTPDAARISAARALVAADDSLPKEPVTHDR